jgi:hypothetical protein
MMTMPDAGFRPAGRECGGKLIMAVVDVDNSSGSGRGLIRNETPTRLSTFPESYLVDGGGFCSGENIECGHGEVAQWLEPLSIRGLAL